MSCVPRQASMAPMTFSALCPWPPVPAGTGRCLKIRLYWPKESNPSLLDGYYSCREANRANFFCIHAPKRPVRANMSPGAVIRFRPTFGSFNTPDGNCSQTWGYAR